MKGTEDRAPDLGRADGQAEGGWRLSPTQGCETGIQATGAAAGVSVMTGGGGETESRQGSHRGRGDLQRRGSLDREGRKNHQCPRVSSGD